MATPLTSKELRDNMEDIVDRVGEGEEFLFIYRSKPAFKLVPIEENSSYVLKSPTAEYGSNRRVPERDPEEVKRILDSVTGILKGKEPFPCPEEEKEYRRKYLWNKYLALDDE